MLHTMGLEVMWRGQIAMPLEDGRIVSTHVWSNPAEKRTYAELILPPGVGNLPLGASRTLRASADRLDATGKPIGIEAAKKEVETQAARLLGRAAGIPAVEVSVPMIYLIAVTSDGLVQSFDAESGQPLWTSTCGSVRFPTAPASVSDAGVVVAQGPNLYLFDLKTGKEMSKHEMRRASTAGVALVDDIAFVASLSGQLVAFEFGKPPTTNPWSFRLYGRAVTSPATSQRNHKLVAFATEQGVVTVFSTEKPDKIEPWFNFEARSPLAGPIGFSSTGLYCGDVAGQVTKVGLDRMGRVEWRLMIGEALGAEPMAVGNTVYLPNEIGDMIAADDSTGVPIWKQATPRVRSILAATEEKVFCRSMTGRLLVIDAKSGKIISQTSPTLIGSDVNNHLNDRIYVVTAKGQIMAVRQRGKEYLMPKFHQPQPVAAETKPRPETTPAPAAPAGTTEESTEDPFGAGLNAADAFGAPAAPAADGAAAPADPFSTPAAGADADTNPFN
jgi:outer membrane protein assembly factor BamB